MISEKWLDHKWSEVIRLLFSGKCAKCRRQGTAAHHIVYRRNRAFRWHPLNGVLLCLECHQWAHSEKEEFEAWLLHNLKHQYKWCIEDYHKNNLTSDKESVKTLLNDTEERLTKHIIGGSK